MRRTAYSLLRRFCEFWSLREAIPALPMLPTPPEIQSEFVPYIYTGEQVLTLLRTTRLNQPTAGRLSHRCGNLPHR